MDATERGHTQAAATTNSSLTRRVVCRSGGIIPVARVIHVLEASSLIS
jgi:hypothetical protein